MTNPLDRLATFTRWRTEIVLTAASIVGLAGLGHELFFTSDPNWLKIMASCAAIAGAPAALLNLVGKGGQP